MRAYRLVISLLLAATVLPPARGALATIHCVNPGGTGGCFATIQAAVDAAANRDRIDVAAGSYAAVGVVPRKGKLTIAGAGAATTSIAGDAIGIHVSGPGTDVTVTGFTVSASPDNPGNAAVRVSGQARATLADVVLTGSSYGLVGEGRVTVLRATVSENAYAGIDVFGRLALQDSTVAANGLFLQYTGGGVTVTGTGSIRSSTITGNRTYAKGSGLTVGGYSKVDVRSSTIAGNQGDTYNSAGVSAYDNSAKVFLRSSIIAGNTTLGEPADCTSLLVNGRLTAMADSLIESPTSPQVVQCVVRTSGGATVLSADPLLGPLQDNGGPTETRALLPGSPALGVVTRRSECKPDQRGVARTAPCDLGAVEVP